MIQKQKVDIRKQTNNKFGAQTGISYPLEE